MGWLGRLFLPGECAQAKLRSVCFGMCGEGALLAWHSMCSSHKNGRHTPSLLVHVTHAGCLERVSPPPPPPRTRARSCARTHTRAHARTCAHACTTHAHTFTRAHTECRGLVLDGSNPTLLYGYGGFNISLEPGFSASRLAFMRGYDGVFAQVKLRAGVGLQ